MDLLTTLKEQRDRCDETISSELKKFQQHVYTKHTFEKRVTDSRSILHGIKFDSFNLLCELEYQSHWLNMCMGWLEEGMSEVEVCDSAVERLTNYVLYVSVDKLHGRLKINTYRRLIPYFKRLKIKLFLDHE